MPNQEALQELQGRLAERLALAQTQEQQKSWLAIQSAGQGFLLRLHEMGEIFPLAPICTVPHTQPWFLGVVNLRGHLHGVIDLADFLRLKRTSGLRDQSRLIALNSHLELNCALQVDALMGLRNETQLHPTGSTQESMSSLTPDFVGSRLQDNDGVVWQELLLSKLAMHESFLKISQESQI